MRDGGSGPDNNTEKEADTQNGKALDPEEKKLLSDFLFGGADEDDDDDGSPGFWDDGELDDIMSLLDEGGDFEVDLDDLLSLLDGAYPAFSDGDDDGGGDI